MPTGKTILLLIIIAFFSSCTHYYYAPNSVNVPLFDTTNQLKSNLVFGYGDEFTSTEIQVAYSLPKIFLEDFFVVGNCFFFNEEYTWDSLPQDNNAKFYELGLGYTKKIS